jgi:hypothetical protein
MNGHWMVLPTAVGAVLGWGALGRAADAPKPEPRAGWFGVFPELAGYGRSFLAPVVAAEKQPVAYRQTARYEWLGGALKHLQVTLARDPAFKQKYAAETLRKDALAPKEVKVGTRTGWLWSLEKEAGSKPDQLAWRLVVPLAADKAVVFEGRGAGPWEEVTGLAQRFDLARAEAALAQPPRTDFRRTLDSFRALTKAVPYSDVVAWVGFADKDVGSGVHVLVYHLADGSRVLVGFADFQSLMYVKHEHKRGEVEDLVK